MEAKLDGAHSSRAFAPSLWLVLLLASAARADEPDWLRVGATFNKDLSGIVCLEPESRRALFLVAHDNKYPHEPRLGLLSLRSSRKLRYWELPWPAEAARPVDVEALASHPDGDGFFLMTSSGFATHVRLSADLDGVEVVQTFLVPLPRQPANAEGFDLWRHGDRLWAVWADRGSDARPGILYWGPFDLESYRVTVAGSAEIAVPYPTRSEVRHVSDLRVDDDGVVFLTAASEASDEGPFDGALYRAGVLRSDGHGLRFEAEEALEPLLRAPGYKLEALDLLAGHNWSFVLGTDNELGGSYLYLGP